MQYFEKYELFSQRVNSFELLLKKDFPQKKERENERAKFHIRFDNAIFDKKIDIGALNIPCAVYFLNSTFEAGIHFYALKFEDKAYFSGANFKGDVLFNFVTCKKGLFVNRTVCEKKFDIMNLEIDKSESLIISIIADEMKVKGDFLLRSKFEESFFQGLSVEGTTDFSGSRFEKVPDFRDCHFSRTPAVGGMVLPKPKMERRLKYLFSTLKDESDVAKFRVLKGMALSNHDHEKDGELFALEMMAKKGVETTRHLELMFNSLYGSLSFYGQSYLRPIAWMFVSFVAFWAGGLAMIKVMTGSLQEFWFAGVHSALNLVPLIGALFRATSTPEGHTSWYDETYHQLADKGLSLDWWAAISAGQQVIGAVLFFLLILGLRNKFRLK